MPEAPIHVPVSLSQLPPFPPIALRALKALSAESSSIKDIEGIISPDAVFSASALHCANSALFGLHSRVRTLRHALALLGMDRLKSLLLTTALQSFVKAPLRSKAFRAWWHHSLASAMLSEALAKASGGNCQEAYLASLLHDIGRLGFIVQRQPPDWRRLRRFAETNAAAGMSILEMERHVFGIDHCAVGERLLKEWGLPDELILAATLHHDTEKCLGSKPLLFASVGCEFSSRLGFAAVEYPRTRPLEQFLDYLPPTVRPLLAADPQTLREALETKIRTLGV